MKVEILNLCDYATGEMTGKMTLVGIFDVIYAKEAPVSIIMCSLAVRLRFDQNEQGIKRIKCTIVDSDGIVIVPATETIVQVRVLPEWKTATAQVVALIPQLRLPHFGDYSVELEIDGRLESASPLYVREVPMESPRFQIPQRPA